MLGDFFIIAGVYIKVTILKDQTDCRDTLGRPNQILIVVDLKKKRQKLYIKKVASSASFPKFQSQSQIDVWQKAYS